MVLTASITTRFKLVEPCLFIIIWRSWGIQWQSMADFCYYFKESSSLHGDAGMLGFYDVNGHVSIRHHTSASLFYCHRTRECKIDIIGSSILFCIDITDSSIWFCWLIHWKNYILKIKIWLVLWNDLKLEIEMVRTWRTCNNNFQIYWTSKE